MSQEQIERIEVTIEDLNKTIDMQESFQRLIKNPDFDKVIGKGYFEQESIRLVLTKADPACDTPELQAALLRGIDAIGELRQYFVKINQTGNMAVRTKQEHEEAREELLAEDLNADAELEA